MDPVTRIVTALVAGGAAGVTTTASRAVETAAQALHAAVRRRLNDRAGSLDTFLRDPVAGHAHLVTALADTGTDRDPAIVAAAGRVHALVSPAAPKYSVELSHSRGTVVGDGNTQTNVFPPRAER